MAFDDDKARPLSEMRFGTMTIAWRQGGVWTHTTSHAVALWAMDVASGNASSTRPQWDGGGWIGLTGEAIGAVTWQPLPNGGHDRVDDSGDFFDWLVDLYRGEDEPSFSLRALAAIRDSAPEHRAGIARYVEGDAGAARLRESLDEYERRKSDAMPDSVECQSKPPAAPAEADAEPGDA